MRAPVTPAVLLCLFVPLALAAQQPAAKPATPSPGAGSQTSKSQPEDSDVFDLIQNSIRFEQSGQGQRDFQFRVHVNSESSVRELGLLAYPFASSFESLEIVYARVRKPDGTVVDTPSSDVQELDSAVSREAPMYTDQREKHIAIKSLARGDVLEVHVRWVIHDPIAPGHFWYTHNFVHDGICRKEILEFDLPRTSNVTLNKTEVQPAIREEKDRRIYTFQTSNAEHAKEPKIPAWETNFGGAKPPDVQLSSFASWEEVGAWFSALAQPKTAVTPELRSRAEELTKSAATQDEKIQALYNFVSTRFRYIGIDLGLSRYTPHSASDVLSNRYGDCKDKHTLLAALLQALNIPSFPVLISSTYRLDSSVPSPALFDHVITAVPRGDTFLFLDTTPEVAPFGLLVPSLRDRQALVIPLSGSAHLVTTPADPPFAAFNKMTVESSLDAKGNLDAKMRLVDRGDSEVALRIAYRSVPRNHWQDLTQRLVANLGFGGTVSDVSAAEPEDTAEPFWVSFSYHRSDLPDWPNHKILLPTPMLSLPTLTDEQKRSDSPLPLGSDQDITYDATVKFPPGFSPFVPQGVSEKTDFAEFSATYSLDDQALHSTVHFKTLARTVPGSERDKYVKLADTIDKTVRSYIFVRGNFPDNPQFLSPLAHIQPEVLIPSLEAALSSHPESDIFLQRLAQAYLEVNRAQDAVALLTKSFSSRSEIPNALAVTLGVAYLKNHETEKALTTFKKALGQDAQPDDLNEAAYALAEANVHLTDALDYSQRAVASIASDTMDIDSDQTDPDDFKLMTSLAANWDTLGWIKFKMGDFASAERYLEASWQLVQQPVPGEHLVEAYQKLGDNSKAAAICLMARATLPHGDASPPAELLDAEMTRLRPFLKKLSALSSSSDSETDGGLALSDIRFFRVPFHATLKGKNATATFLIYLVNGPKVDHVAFLSGSDELREAVIPISAVKFRQNFPDATPARIVRKATLNCDIYSNICNLILEPTQTAAVVPFPFGFPPPSQ